MMLIERILILPLTLAVLGVGSALFGTDDLAFTQPAVASVSAAWPKPAAALVRRRSADGLFRVPIGTTGQGLEALVDTGATHSFVTSATLARLTASKAIKPPLAKGQRLFVTARGPVRFAVVRVAQFPVGPYSVGPIDLVVLKDKDLPNIVGRDIMARLGTVRIAGDELSIR